MHFQNKKNKWLIIGGSGQLGQSLQRELLKSGIEFIAPSSRTLDIRNFEKTKEYITSVNPSFVINCSGWTNVRDAENNSFQANILNGYAVDNLFRSCNDISSLFLHVSTDYVFSGSKGLPYSETDLTDPINAYGYSKALGEQLMINHNVESFYIFRTAWLYSEFGNNFVKEIIFKLYSGNTDIEVVNDQFGNPTNAHDLAKRIIESVTSNIPFGIYNAVNTGSVSWYDFAVRIMELIGAKNERIKPISSNKYISTVIRPLNSSLDTSKWGAIGMSEMRSWDKALELQIPSINNLVKASGLWK